MNHVTPVDPIASQRRTPSGAAHTALWGAS
jgi:hypothetical protein